MTRPRITVITPNLNGAAYLERTMCSVLDQIGLAPDAPAIEYLVVDGGSTDDSTDIIQRYADELTWWRSAADNGPADAINRALARATGDIVTILPAGDLYLPDALAQVAARFARADAPSWLIGHCMRIGPRDGELGTLEAAPPANLAGLLMHDSGVLPQPATFYRRALLDEHGPFDADLRYAFGYEMACRLVAAGEMPALLPCPLAAHRERDALRDIDQTLRAGREYVDAALRYADHLSLSQRYALWRNCEQRRRIYALAEAEAGASAARSLLWQRVLRHPWWMASPTYRHALLHGTQPTSSRPAA